MKKEKKQTQITMNKRKDNLSQCNRSGKLNECRTNTKSFNLNSSPQRSRLKPNIPETEDTKKLKK